jgi:hypothetical protein
MFMKKNIAKICLLILGGAMASCLEDDKPALDPSGTQNIIEFLDPSVPSSPSGSVYPAYSASFTLAPEATFEQIISFSGANENGQDITLQLAVDPSALSEYNYQMHNSLHGTEYELMPESNYEISTFTVTIPKGQTKVSLPITVYPDQFDFSKDYAIPLRIVTSSSGTLSAHFSVAILNVGVRNIYDGVYDVKAGNIQRNSATGPDPALSGDYKAGIQISLRTMSADRLAFEPVWKDGSGIAGIDGTSIQVLGTTNPDGTSPIKITSSTNPVLKNTPTLANVYNPADAAYGGKPTFTINIDWGAAPSTRVITGLKLVYNSPRP